MYDDNFVDPEDSYVHSKWLSFMERRLRLAYDLLADDGMIFIQINDIESSNLRLLCNAIFKNNFISEISVEMSPSSGVKRRHRETSFIKNKESILVFGKNKQHRNLKPLFNEWFVYDNHYSIFFDGKIYCSLLNLLKKEFPMYEKLNSRFYLAFDDLYEFIVNNSNKIYRTHDASKWALENVENGINLYEDENIIIKKVPNPSKDNDYEILKSTNGKKKYNRLEPLAWNVVNKKLCTLRGDLWLDFDKDIGNVSKEGNIKFPNGKKPVRLLKEILWSSTNKDSIVLDFFAGSGTTGEAVLQLNAEDDGNRKFILCTNNENNICENITYKRLLNVIEGYTNQEAIPANLMYYKTDFIKKKDDGSVPNKLNKHVIELVQLEHHCKVDQSKIIVVFSEKELDNMLNTNINCCKCIYKPSSVALTKSQEDLITSKKIKIYNIPNYYFAEELLEIGE